MSGCGAVPRDEASTFFLVGMGQLAGLTGKREQTKPRLELYLDYYVVDP